jgi:hypothetical protein
MPQNKLWVLVHEQRKRSTEEMRCQGEGEREEDRGGEEQGRLGQPERATAPS